MQVPGFATEDFFAHITLLGANFEDEQQLKFTKLSIQYSHLPEWCGLSGLRRDVEINDNRTLQRYAVAYTYPDEVSAETSLGKVTVTFTVRGTGDLLREATIKQLVSLRIEPHEPMGLEALFRTFVTPFQNLLSLATSRPNAVTSLVVYSPAAAHTRSNGEVRQEPIEVFYQPIYMHEEEGEKRVHPSDMLFTLADVAADFSQCMEKWLKVTRELDSVCNLFFSIRYRPTYLEHRFMNTVQAVESYHRRRFKNTRWPRAEYRERVKRSVDGAPAEYRDWLKEQLAYGNEPRLADRLIELVTTVDESIGPLVRDPEVFVREVKDTRNYNTHYDERLKNKAATGERMVELIDILGVLMEACLLRELGFSPDQRATVFNDQQHYLFVKRRSAQGGNSEATQESDAESTS
jgi:hypothetical protein